MAVYLNRTLSMMSGNLGSPSHDNTNGLDRLIHNNAYDNSPLQVFVKAKKKINDIYGEIEEYVVETAYFMNNGNLMIFSIFNNKYKSFVCPNMLILEHLTFIEHNDSLGIIDKAEAEQFQSYVHKVAAIRQVLDRDHMKCAFFGRTSNGKSSVINAMLREKILPSGIGHTTNCFCQVEGVDGTEAYLVKEGSDEQLNVAVSVVMFILS